MNIVCYDAHTFEKEFLLNAAAGKHEIRFLKLQLTAETVDLAHDAEAVLLFVNDEGSAPILENFTRSESDTLHFVPQDAITSI